MAVVALLASAALVASAACSSSGFNEHIGTFTARGSVEQLWVTGAAPGGTITVTNGHNAKVDTATADTKGSVLFHGLAPGGGYRVYQDDRGVKTASPRVKVLSRASAPPDPKVYDQTLPIGGYAGHERDGYGYLTTRDGTSLAVNVKLPGPPDKGPYPTVMEYSGYAYANPAGGQSSISQILGLFGYAVVDVNMRGTGCSGGVFDYFEPLQSLDGYDVIETVARQSWTMHHKVGMIGVSYGGISQLFVGSTAPPDLAAIAPMSVIDNTATTLYPGGMLNSGFAKSWAIERAHDAMSASATTGQPWAWKQIQVGDKTCETNQALRSQTPDLLAKMRANDHYDPKVADPLNPTTFVSKVDVPVFLACQWEDEQTGGHCAELASKFTGTAHKWFTFTNGTHIDSIDPATFNRWYDFLELYVAQHAPHMPDSLKALSPTIFKAAMGVDGVVLPPDSIQAEPDYQHALGAFEALPAVRILFDNGAGAAPGAPVPGFEQSFQALPIPGAQAQNWYFGPDSSLTADKPTVAGADSFNWKPDARPSTNFAASSSDIWSATPSYQWKPLPEGTAASYVTAPLTRNTVAVGSGSVDLWLQSNQADTDLQVTLSEVRPDGQEVFVQNGWLRASDRKLDARSSETNAVPTYLIADAAPLPSGQWSPVRVPLYYSGHAFRAGSRIRITVEAPGGDQPFWEFGVLTPNGPVVNNIARAPEMASRLVLPVVTSVNVSTKLPPHCPGLRGEPCRAYQPFANTSSAAR